MALKRKHDDSATAEASASQATIKKAWKGFTVGPDHLPEGQYRRKVQRIKKTLVAKAKLKRSFSNLQSRPGTIPRKSASESASHHYDPYREPEPLFPLVNDVPNSQPALEQPQLSHTQSNALSPASLNPHPDREQRILQSISVQLPDSEAREDRSRKRVKPSPFAAAESEAARRRQEAVIRREERGVEMKRRAEEGSRREWESKQLERAKGGGPGRRGRRKLGAESGVLLERVKRLVDGQQQMEGCQQTEDFRWMWRQQS